MKKYTARKSNEAQNKTLNTFHSFHPMQNSHDIPFLRKRKMGPLTDLRLLAMLTSRPTNSLHQIVLGSLLAGLKDKRINNRLNNIMIRSVM